LDFYNDSYSLNLDVIDDPQMTFSPSAGGPGTIIYPTGTGFFPNGSLVWRYDADPDVPGSGFIIPVPDDCAQADENGEIKATCEISLPTGLPGGGVGGHEISVEDANSNAQWAHKTATDDFDLKAPNLVLEGIYGHPGDTFTVRSGDEPWITSSTVEMIPSNANFTDSKSSIAVSSDGHFGPETFTISDTVTNKESTRIKVNTTGGLGLSYFKDTEEVTAYVINNTSVSPSSGRINQDVTIHGEGFIPAASIYYKSPDCGQDFWTYTGAGVSSQDLDGGGVIPDGITIPLPHCKVGENKVYLSDAQNDVPNTVAEIIYNAYAPELVPDTRQEHMGGTIVLNGTGFTPNQTGLTISTSGGIVAEPNIVNTDAQGRLTPPVIITAPEPTSEGFLQISDSSSGDITFEGIAFIGPPTLEIDKHQGPPGTLVDPIGTTFIGESKLTWEYTQGAANLQKPNLNNPMINDSDEPKFGAILNVPPACQMSDADGLIKDECLITIPTNLKPDDYTIVVYDISDAPWENKSAKTQFKVLEPKAQVSGIQFHRGDTLTVSSAPEIGWTMSKKVKITPELNSIVTPESLMANVNAEGFFTSEKFTISNKAKNGEMSLFTALTTDGPGVGFSAKTEKIKVYVPYIILDPIGDDNPPKKVEVIGGGFFPGEQIYWKGCMSNEPTPLPGVKADKDGNIPKGIILDLTQCTLPGPLVFGDSKIFTPGDSVTASFQIPNYSGTGISIKFLIVAILSFLLAGFTFAISRRKKHLNS
jgi:hypothetical protein